MSGEGFNNGYMNYKWSDDRASTTTRTSTMSRSVEIEVIKGYSPYNWLGGKVDVIEGTMYTVSMYLKFIG